MIDCLGLGFGVRVRSAGLYMVLNMALKYGVLGLIRYMRGIYVFPN